MQEDTYDQKGVRFLELVDKQNTLQQAMVSKLTALISTHNWNSDELKTELEDMAKEHSDITREINGLD